MNDWAVIALQLIENELPVGVNVETIAPRKNHSLKVLNGLVNLRLKAVDLAGQRFGACVEIDEYQEPEQRLHSYFGEPKILVAKTGHVLCISRRLERALGVVGPGVKRTRKDGAVSLALYENMAAMHADVEKGP